MKVRHRSRCPSILHDFPLFQVHMKTLTDWVAEFNALMQDRIDTACKKVKQMLGDSADIYFA